jgi:hypothetical protein
VVSSEIRIVLLFSGVHLSLRIAKWAGDPWSWNLDHDAGSQFNFVWNLPPVVFGSPLILEPSF